MTTPEQTPEAAPEAPPAAAPGAPVTGTGNITFEDVRIALGETDPDETHAGKLRAIIGRGSNKTIQMHLDAIRKARAPAMPGTQAPPPPIPKDVMESIWSAAWASAQAKTYGRTELLSAERDAALKSSTTRASEIEALNADVDGLREKITLAEQNAAALAAKTEADLTAAGKAAAEATEALQQALDAKDKAEADAAQAAALAAAEAAKALEQMKAEKAKVEADAAHADQLATLKAQVAKNAMQETINILNNQIVDLKGLMRSTTTIAIAPAPAENQAPQ